MNTGQRAPGPRRQRRQPGGAPRRINVRTSAGVFAELARRAQEAGCSLPRYLVECGLRASSGTASLRQQRQLGEQLGVTATRLRMVGSNLNQIAAKLHSTGELDEGLVGALAYHRATLARLDALLAALEATPASSSPR